MELAGHEGATDLLPDSRRSTGGRSSSADGHELTPKAPRRRRRQAASYGAHPDALALSRQLRTCHWPARRGWQAASSGRRHSRAS
jgi:hypothetical protein